jgi:hypothetical protein
LSNKVVKGLSINPQVHGGLILLFSEKGMGSEFRIQELRESLKLGSGLRAHFGIQESGVAGVQEVIFLFRFFEGKTEAPVFCNSCNSCILTPATSAARLLKFWLLFVFAS